MAGQVDKMSTLSETRHGALHDLAGLVEEVLAEFCFDPDIREHAGATVATRFCEMHGGAVLYFPTDSRYTLAKRDKEILSQFKGNNHRELAKQYNLTPSAIYKLLKRAKAQKSKGAAGE